MDNLGETLSGLAPGVGEYRILEGEYNPRHGLAIYFLPSSGPSIAQPGTVLGEALASRSGLGCTLLEGIPPKVPSGAAVIGIYKDLLNARPDLLDNVPEIGKPGEYAVKLGRSCLVAGVDRDGLVAGIQTLAMTILRHPDQVMPSAVIIDSPKRLRRGLTIELRQEELSPALLFQIMSFAATFKANTIKWILPTTFDPGSVLNMEVVNLAASSNGFDTSVGMPLLAPLLAGEWQPADAWSSLRSAAKTFGATKAFLDDPCPDDIPQAKAKEIVDSIIHGDTGLAKVAVDVNLLLKAGIDPTTMNSTNLSVWARVNSPEDIPAVKYNGKPVPLDIPSHMCGLSSRGVEAFYDSLDAAASALDGEGSLVVSFRGLGFSHAWQNYLSGAATGLIVAWGKPATAREAAASYSELLYGDAAANIMKIWGELSHLFPDNLDNTETRRLGEIAFGEWPESMADKAILAKIDWQKVVNDINNIAGRLETVTANLTRNRTTLSGPYLSLQILAWLCRLAILPPELEAHGGDTQANSIASELMKSFMEWRQYLENLQIESGMDLINMDKIDTMGTRIRFICGESVDPGEDGAQE